MIYQVKFIAYNGMTIPLGENLEKEEAQDIVKKQNKGARGRGQPVIRLAGNCWEHCEEDDCGMISSRHGILAVSRKRI